MSMEKLFHLPDGTPCNAAETVCRMLGAAPAFPERVAEAVCCAGLSRRLLR